MADNFVAWPAMVDDDGSLTVGTVTDKALYDAIRASLADNVYSATNPEVKTKTIIDEVIAARGSKASLDARLSVSIGPDGVIIPSSVYPMVVAAGYSGAEGYGTFRTVNLAKKAISVPINTLAANGDFLIVEATGAEIAANTGGMGIAVGAAPTDYSSPASAAAARPFMLRVAIVRVSATSVQVQGMSENAAIGISSGVALVVADLAANALDLVVGMRSDAGAGVSSKLYFYSVIRYGVR